MASKTASVVLSTYRLLLLTRKFICRQHRRNPNPNNNRHSYPSPEKLCNKTLVVDVENGILKSSSTYPYFMSVAVECGGLFRGLLLLLLFPLLCCLHEEAKLTLMVMVSFCGLKEKEFRAGTSVLPKLFLEDVGVEGFDIMKSGGKRVICMTCLPRVMVESFLKEYLQVEAVVGRELKVLGGYYTGFMERRKNTEELRVFSEDLKDGDSIGFGSPSTSLNHELFSLCNEVYLVGVKEKGKWHVLPRESYPKRLIFHDGRLAFRPTPAATLAMFIWLPFGLILAVVRALICIVLPYKLIILICAFLGMKLRHFETLKTHTRTSPMIKDTKNLYVANHRTLLDPIYIAAAINKPVTAVVYSISRISEILSPIGTVRLTRNKEEDQKRMMESLKKTNVVVHPEGTTCREPYLLRFSPLFAELTDDIIPVTVASRVGMFYGTSAAGLKGFDPLCFLLNPCPEYVVELLEKISTKTIREKYDRYKAANHVQKELANALGFKCTNLTRKDKYMMLAGKEGLVGRKRKD